jgi:hypothetical protein
MRFGRNAYGGICLLAWSLAGCTGFGPATMRYQQADYAAALADAGKRQTLLNIVRLRYGDVPAFVTVNQILAGYSLQGSFSVGTCSAGAACICPTMPRSASAARSPTTRPSPMRR